jgi:hypothetical protein
VRATLLLQLKALCFVTVLLVTSPVLANDYKYHPSNTLHLGSSFNPLRPYQAYNTCITYDSVIPVQGDHGSITTEFTSNIVNSREELYRHLNVDASLSASYLFASGSASFSLDQEYSFSSHDLTWIVKGATDYGRFVMGGMRLTPEAEALRKNPVAFAERCGYEFVAQEHRAVQVVAVYTLHDLTESEKTKLSLSISAQASFALGDFKLSAASPYSQV